MVQSCKVCVAAAAFVIKVNLSVKQRDHNTFRVTMPTIMVEKWLNPYDVLGGIATLVYNNFLNTWIANDRLFGLKYLLKHEMFYFSCAGYTPVGMSEEIMLQKLTTRRKCNNWTGSGSLTCHNFLSYSCLMHMRLQTWVLIVLNLLIHGIYCTTACSIKSPDDRTDLILGEYLRVLWMVLDFTHMLLSVFDIINLRSDKLEDFPRQKADRSEFVKLFLLAGLTFAWIRWADQRAKYFGMYIYLVVCSVVAQVVNFQNLAPETVLRRSPRRPKQSDEEQLKERARILNKISKRMYE